MMDAVIRTFTAEGPIIRGSAVVIGSSEGHVRLPGVDGAGVFIGIYDALRNTRDAVDGEHVPITVLGLCQVHAFGVVSAGIRGSVNDAQGLIRNVSDAVGIYEVVGRFLQDGTAGELVEFIVERGQVTVSTPGP